MFLLVRSDDALAGFGPVALDVWQQRDPGVHYSALRHNEKVSDGGGQALTILQNSAAR
jgi:hypothetical protein